MAGLDETRAKFVAENLYWRGALDYLPRDFSVKATRVAGILVIAACVKDYGPIHSVEMPANLLHPGMDKALAASFKTAIGGEEPEEMRGAA